MTMLSTSTKDNENKITVRTIEPYSETINFSKKRWADTQIKTENSSNPSHTKQHQTFIDQKRESRSPTTHRHMHHKQRKKQSLKKNRAKLVRNTNNANRKRKKLSHPTDLQNAITRKPSKWYTLVAKP